MLRGCVPLAGKGGGVLAEFHGPSVACAVSFDGDQFMGNLVRYGHGACVHSHENSSFLLGLVNACVVVLVGKHDVSLVALHELLCCAVLCCAGLRRRDGWHRFTECIVFDLCCTGGGVAVVFPINGTVVDTANVTFTGCTVSQNTVEQGECSIVLMGAPLLCFLMSGGCCDCSVCDRRCGRWPGGHPASVPACHALCDASESRREPCPRVPSMEHELHRHACTDRCVWQRRRV